MAKLKEKKAIYGEKMIEVKVRFWTNNIARSKDKIVPKNAWTNGMIMIKRNKNHKIDPGPAIPFNSLSEIAPGIEQCLIDHGIKLHVSGKMEKYIEVD